ncbi:MAG: head GIN domain-containing protein [Pseudomonadota bacterium]
MTTTSKRRFSLRHFAAAAAVMAAFGTLGLVLPVSPSYAGSSFWGSEKVEGSGSIKTEARQLAQFTGLSLAIPAKLELRIGATESITIETDDNLLPLIETVVERGILKIKPSKNNMNLRANTLRIVVQAKQIDRISLGGSGSVTAAALRAPSLSFDLGGSGQIDIGSIDAKSVAVSIGGSGKLRAGGGATEELTVSIGGSGDVDLGKVSTNIARVSVAGSGEATVWAQKSLAATIAGSGDVNYYGDPSVAKSSVGSGDVTRLGGAPR